MRERYESPDLWLEANIDGVRKILSEYQENWRIRERQKYPAYAALFNPTLRSLSEMPICRAHRKISRKLGLPLDYSVVSGLVFAVNVQGEKIEYFHLFLKNSGGEIMDFTAGQFIEWGDKPGDRTSFLKLRSPSFVTAYANGISVVKGPQNELAEELDLVYKHPELDLTRVVVRNI